MQAALPTTQNLAVPEIIVNCLVSKKFLLVATSFYMVNYCLVIITHCNQ